MYFVLSEILATRANDLTKRTNSIKVCLMNLNDTLYYVFPLDICEYPQYS